MAKRQVERSAFYKREEKNMQVVTFPGLGIQLTFSKIAFSFMGIDIYWYAVIIVAAILIGMVLCKKKDGLYGISYQNIIDLFLYLLPISILSARAYYVIFNPSYFIQNPLQIFNLRTGGLAIYGGIIGGVITAYVFCKKRKIPLLDLLDFLAPCLILGQAIGRWGNFINVEAYGYETNLPWRMGIMSINGYQEVHPTFLYESIIDFVIFFLLLHWQRKRKYSGQITYLYLVCYSFARMLIELLRTDSLFFYHMRISSVLSLFIFVASCLMLVKNQKTQQKKSQKQAK